jgi:hypothetical protein
MTLGGTRGPATEQLRRLGGSWGGDGGCVSVTARPPKWGMHSDEFFGTGCAVEADSPIFGDTWPR